jgi:dephospho-CoA kinase
MEEKKKVRIIGITGGIGSGKSTVGRMLADRGMVVIDSDEIARELVEPGSEALEQIIWEFGEDILTIEGRLDRVKMASLIFNNESKRAVLERILHPRICVEYRRLALESGKDIVFVMMPLLFEAGLENDVDQIWLCYAQWNIRLERAMKRDNASREAIIARMNAQIPDHEKIYRSDVVFDTSGPIEDVGKQVDEALRALDGAAK